MPDNYDEAASMARNEHTTDAIAANLFGLLAVADALRDVAAAIREGGTQWVLSQDGHRAVWEPLPTAPPDASARAMDDHDQHQAHAVLAALGDQP